MIAWTSVTYGSFVVGISFMNVQRLKTFVPLLVVLVLASIAVGASAETDPEPDPESTVNELDLFGAETFSGSADKVPTGMERCVNHSEFLVGERSFRTDIGLNPAVQVKAATEVRYGIRLTPDELAQVHKNEVAQESIDMLVVNTTLETELLDVYVGAEWNWTTAQYDIYVIKGAEKRVQESLPSSPSIEVIEIETELTWAASEQISADIVNMLVDSEGALDMRFDPTCGVLIAITDTNEIVETLASGIPPALRKAGTAHSTCSAAATLTF